MANMSYCRYRNTLNDLQDCYDSMSYDEDGDELSREESNAKEQLLELCAEITDQFNDAYDLEDAE